MTKHIAHSVIITRPLAQADALARRVAALGRDAIVFPLIEIHPLADPAPLLAALADLSSYAMVAFVSPNAIDAVFTVLRSWPREVALAVMGEGSRRALAHHGVTVANATIMSPTDPERTDSQTLLDALDVGALHNKRVLIVRGEAGRELLADALRAAGAQVTQVAAYRRRAPDLDVARRKQLGQLLDSRNDWIVTSSEALRIAMQMAEQACGAAGVAKMQQQTIIVPHVRIQETAQMLGFRHITLTGSGDERLLAALQS
jgi:uroporphyrinogen-III synthase